MRIFSMLISALIISLLLITIENDVLSQASEHTPLFQLFGNGPIINHGPPGDWDSTYNDPGAVFYYDGQFHMFRNGLQSLVNGGASIGYLTSPDGLNWAEVSDEPVMATADVPYTSVTAQVGTVIVEDDGTWVMYFHVLDTPRFPLSGGSIGRATADNPLGPWTPDQEPLLRPGSSSEWDGVQVSHPRVVRSDQGYALYYSGYNAQGRMAIGVAFSQDGINWQKYNDSSTSVSPYAESDPILVATDPWEYHSLQHPGVVRTPDGWVMIYRTPGLNGNVGSQVALGLATSDDGISWTKYTNNPIMIPSDIPNGRWIWFNALAYHNGTYFLYMEASIQFQLGGITDIYASTYEGSMPPNF